MEQTGDVPETHSHDAAASSSVVVVGDVVERHSVHSTLDEIRDWY